MDMQLSLARFHEILSWYGIMAGIISGAFLGLFFQKRDWLGGYASFERRLLRLGHIAFFGFAFLNHLLASGLQHLFVLTDSRLELISNCFLLATITMPLVCMLCARWKRCYFLFPIPVVSAMLSLLLIIISFE